MLVKKTTVSYAAILAVSTAILLSGCSDDKKAKAAFKMPTPEVEVAPVVLGEHGVNMTLTGRTKAFYEADVRPQVSGILLKRLYREGDDVKAGQPLYQIDPAPYRAELNTARAKLAQAQANLSKAREDAKRSAALVKVKAVSQQADDAAQAALSAAKASLKAAQAAVDMAQINLGYTKVLSPISGRAGRSEYTEGALMSGYQANRLTTVQQLDPMYVDVVQTAEDLMRIRQEIASGAMKTDPQGNARVSLTLADGTVYPHMGKLTFTGVTVNETTGNVNLRMVFPNPDRVLMPGLFVRTQIQEGVRPNSALVGMQSVMHTPRGEAYVYVISKDDKVEKRMIEATRTVGTSWLVESGLKEGDRIVFKGFQRIRPGMQVKAKVGNPDVLAETGKPLF